jgi:hypothetical protein
MRRENCDTAGVYRETYYVGISSKKWREEDDFEQIILGECILVSMCTTRS